MHLYGSESEYFDRSFFALTGYSPFEWQRRLFVDYFARGIIPSALDIPTGLGKTSVMTVWLLALAWLAQGTQGREERAKLGSAGRTPNPIDGRIYFPRRLVYVVNRRTVVDQATDVAEQLRRRLRGEGVDRLASAECEVLAHICGILRTLCVDPDDQASPLAISTLRGERADNREWQADPARPAVVIGTVDMIGSRLLFSGYGVSNRMRPLHAGLLGHDVLIVHDEAHLAEPFGRLIRDLAERQERQRALRPLRVMELSATPRIGRDAAGLFELRDEEKREPGVIERLLASKRLHFASQAADTEDAAIQQLIEFALRYRGSRARVLVYVRSPKHAAAIAQGLARETRSPVPLLTGTIRGYERDQLTTDPRFEAFRASRERTALNETVYLVATSAGEVGIDLDADHMVCDLTTLDSMIQRLGRVNRLGGREAEVHVVEWPARTREDGEAGDYESRLAATKAALVSLPAHDGTYDASPENLRTLARRAEAFAGSPPCALLTEILIDNWALTCIDDLPGRPVPQRWLHGIEVSEPDVYVAWRAEVTELGEWIRGLGKSPPKNLGRRILTLYDKHPILSRERLRAPLGEVKAELRRIANRKPKQEGSDERVLAILLPVSGAPVMGPLAELLEEGALRLGNATIVLPPEAGGLDDRGMLDASAGPDSSRPYDVADDAGGGAIQRARVWLTWLADEARWTARWLGRRDGDDLDAAVAPAASFTAALSRVRERAAPLVEKEVLEFENEEGECVGALVLFAAPDSVEIALDNPGSAAGLRTLEEHLRDTRAAAEAIVKRLAPLAMDLAEAEKIAGAVVLAADRHDRGKDRDAWQADIGNPRLQRPGAGWTPLAKSGGRGFVSRLSGAYRHEFGSLREATEDPEIQDHPERELILHLIAAHHGWARPHFEPEQGDIADGVSEEDNAALAAETMRRFGRLQRRFGHWGLAWLEALVRTADYIASGRLARMTSRSMASVEVAGGAAEESAA